MNLKIWTINDVITLVIQFNEKTACDVRNINPKYITDTELVYEIIKRVKIIENKF